LNKFRSWVTQSVYDLYKESLRQFAFLQVKGHEELNYKKCLTNSSFKQAIMADLLYFKYYFRRFAQTLG
jgi:hypothetical protein